MKADWIRTALKQPSGFLILIGALGLVLILLGDAGGAQAAEVQSADTRTQIEAYGAQLEERLEALVESITVENNQCLRFRLRNSLEIRETV